MRVVEQLYQLEKSDTSLDEARSTLRGVEAELQDRSAITRMETQLEEERERLADEERKRRVAESEVQDVEAKVAGVKEKLYSGKVTNPRELVNLERELRQHESILKGKDETALDLMLRVDEMRTSTEAKSNQLGEARRHFERRRGELESQRAELKKQIAALEEQHERMVSNIVPHALELYQMLRATGGRAVVEVERGVCVGCRLSVPVNELRSLEGEELVRCSNCGRILFLP